MTSRSKDVETDSELIAALRAAVEPTELDPSHHAEILARALQDPLAPPSEQELADSARLREALAGGGAHPGARWAEALRSAWWPSELAGGERLVAGVLGSSARGRLLRIGFGSAATALALAAATALLVGSPSRDWRINQAALVRSQSTSPLFSAKFTVRQTSGRVDLIAQARSRDLRRNRYLGWGVE